MSREQKRMWLQHCKLHYRMVLELTYNYRGNDKSLARPDWKKQLEGRHFSSDAEVIAAAEIWLDGQPSEFFFWVACKSQSLVAVACFLPRRAKDLPAPQYKLYTILLFIQFLALSCFWIVFLGYYLSCTIVSGAQYENNAVVGWLVSAFVPLKFVKHN